jgi:inhibitor of KinA sporulation pathway (predicted exonuclease)
MRLALTGAGCRGGRVAGRRPSSGVARRALSSGRVRQAAAKDGPAGSACQPYDYFCVLDFEATCEKGRRNGPTFQAEVIELPSVLLDGRTMRAVDEFQSYVRPVVNPVLTAFCTELTGIEQSWVEESPPFPEALRQHTAWLQKHGIAVSGASGKSVACVTCGDWDLKTMLPDQLRLLHGRRPAVPAHFRRWVNIKKVYAQSVPTGRRSKASDLTGMLKGLGLTLEGRHHSGIDDCRNIANVVRALAERGAALEVTTGGSTTAAARDAGQSSSRSPPQRKGTQRRRKKGAKRRN